MSQRARARRADEGLTLVELIISISVMGLIATVVAAVITTTFTNNPMNELRADAAHTLKGLVTWLPQDVDSTPPTGFDLDPTVTSGCASSPGKSLLRMEWSESTGGVNTRYIANYRWVTTGTNQQIKRVICSGTGSGPLGNTAIINASGALTPMTAAWAPGNLPARVVITRDATGDVTLVAFDVQTAEGDILHVDSAPKNPANTLTPTTVEAGYVPVTTVLATTTTIATTTTVSGSTTSTSSTSSTTTTTTAPPVCAVTGLTMSVAELRNTDPNGNGKAAANVGVLAQSLTIMATTNGACSGLDARAASDAANGELFHNFGQVTGTNNFTVTFNGYPQGSSELWRDGDRVITVFSPTGAALGAVTLAVK